MLTKSQRAVFFSLVLSLLVLSSLLTSCARRAPIVRDEIRSNPIADAEQNTAAVVVDGQKQAKLHVVASTFVVWDFCRKIADDRIELDLLMPLGAEPHGWEPTAGEMVTLEKADLFILNGAGMEPWADKLRESLDDGRLAIVDSSASLALIGGPSQDDTDKDDEHGCSHSDCHEQHEDDADCHSSDCHEQHEDDADCHADDGQGADACGHHHASGAADPHVWLSPKLAEQQALTICQALTAADPDGKDFYEDHFARLSERFRELDGEYRQGTATLKHRELLTNHAAFAYLCRDYGLSQIGVTGVYADQEPSPARMAEIIRLVKEHEIPCIFTEELLSPKIAATIAEESGLKTAILNPLGNLSKADMEAGKDYFSVMRENLASLRENLQ